MTAVATPAETASIELSCAFLKRSGPVRGVEVEEKYCLDRCAAHLLGYDAGAAERVDRKAVWLLLATRFSAAKVAGQHARKGIRKSFIILETSMIVCRLKFGTMM